MTCLDDREAVVDISRRLVKSCRSQCPKECARNRQHADSAGKPSERGPFGPSSGPGTGQSGKETQTDAEVAEKRMAKAHCLSSKISRLLSIAKGVPEDRLRRV